MTHNNILYRMFDSEGRLLYVGITMSPQIRLRDHRIQKPWFSEVVQIALEHFGSREELEAAERSAVRVESPRYNVVRYSKLERTTPRRRRFTLRATPAVSEA